MRSQVNLSNLTFSFLVVLLVIAGLSVDRAKGLTCPICFRIGPYGSAECEDQFPCNNEADLRRSQDAMDVWKAEVRNELDWVLDEGTPDPAKTLRRSSRPPVCRKIRGRIRSRSSSYPFVMASCVSGDGYSNLVNDTCTTDLSHMNHFKHQAAPTFTLDKICACGGYEDAIVCKVSEEELAEIGSGSPSASSSALEHIYMYIWDTIWGFFNWLTEGDAFRTVIKGLVVRKLIRRFNLGEWANEWVNYVLD